MKILAYEYDEFGTDQWNFSRFELDRRLNLIVGDSGSGKTRFLNTLFSLGQNVATKPRPDKLLHGTWNVRLEQNQEIYNWTLKIVQDPSKTGSVVEQEHLYKEFGNQKNTGKEQPIIDRDKTKFRFNGNQQAKLSRQNTSLELLQEEDIIRPLYDGFGKILRRDFSKAGLQSYFFYELIQKELLDQKIQSLDQLFLLNQSLNSRLSLLRRNFKELYEQICAKYIELFPSIEKIDIRNVKNISVQIETSQADDMGLAPVFSIKEKNVDSWIPSPELASGMQKALLILADIYSMPNGAIYLLDEYENSLGISVIDFLPQCLSEIDTDIQLILTSHHPYIINQIPIENWIVFHRDGANISARYGKENIDAYGKSKQDSFIQLINDPFYNRSLE